MDLCFYTLVRNVLFSSLTDDVGSTIHLLWSPVSLLTLVPFSNCFLFELFLSNFSSKFNIEVCWEEVSTLLQGILCSPLQLWVIPRILNYLTHIVFLMIEILLTQVAMDNGLIRVTFSREGNVIGIKYNNMDNILDYHNAYNNRA